MLISSIYRCFVNEGSVWCNFHHTIVISTQEYNVVEITVVEITIWQYFVENSMLTSHISYEVVSSILYM